MTETTRTAGNGFLSIALGRFWAIFERELAAFFLSPMSYLTWGVFLLAAGYLFVTGLKDGANASMSANFTEIVTLIMFVTPLITMRLIAEESRAGTLEVLLTDPVGDFTIVVGKFLASLVFFCAFLSPTILFSVVMSFVGHPDLGPIISGYFGLLLLGAVFLAIGVMASAIASNQIAAAALSFTMIFVLWMLGRASESIGPGSISEIADYISASGRYEAFLRGLIDTRSIVYFVSLTFIALIIATRALGLRRLR